MAATSEQLPTLRHESPPPDTLPTPALGACPELSRCLSTASTVSHGSSTDAASRDSLGSSLGSETFSRHSSGSYGRRSDVSFASSRQSTCSSSNRRRGYVRPQGTDFAASAKSRESVLSLGSIAHLQYYFARTGLLDGKGGQVARKRQQNRGTLDLSPLDTSSLAPKIVGSDADSSYASMANSPEFAAHGFGVGPLVESPIEAPEEYYSDEFEEPDPNMLPPTASTYIHREKPVPRPPTIEELKSDLSNSLNTAAEAMKEAHTHKDAKSQLHGDEEPQADSPGWYEVQGMHILDVMTLAIRAAKVYYTAHEQPERLDAIKPEKELRAELFSVMESLKQMATRRFAGGMTDEEMRIMDDWIQGLLSMLKQEEDMNAAEEAQRARWTWLVGDWSGKEVERELAFLDSLVPDAEPLATFTRAAEAATLPTPFLESMQNGLRLIKYHNAAVKMSRRRFGAIPTFHTDTQKPYRCADNLRYWVKAAELRWEVMLKIDALGIVYNSNPGVWVEFEAAIFAWCKKVREEIATEVQQR